MERVSYASGTIWEEQVGYSRAVRVGSHVFVSGTTATDTDGKIVGVGDAYQQTVQIIKNIEYALQSVGASLSTVVRTRMFVVDIDDWEAVARAHAAAFSDIKPVTTMVEVSRLIVPEILVEIEVDAIV